LFLNFLILTKPHLFKPLYTATSALAYNVVATWQQAGYW